MATKAKRLIVIAMIILLSAGTVLAIAGLTTVSGGKDILSLWGSASSYPKVDAAVLKEYKPVFFAGIRPGAFLSAGDRYVMDATAYLIDAEFFHVYPIDVLWGVLPEEYPAQAQAIVSESLAFALYGHTHCIGRIFNYDGTDYEITAVCADSGGQKALYLWVSSMENAPVTLLGISKEVDGGTRWIAKDRFASLMDAYTLQYTAYDTAAARHRIYFIFLLFVFVLALLFFLLLIPRIWRFAVQKYRMLKEMSRDKYIRDMLPQIVLWSAAAVVFVVVVLVLCKKGLDVLAVQLTYLDTPDDFYDLKGLRELFRSIFDPADKRGIYFPAYMASIWRGERLIKIGCHLIGAGVLLGIPVFGLRKRRGRLVGEK